MLGSSMWAPQPKDFLLFPQQLSQRAQVQESTISLCAHIVQEAQDTRWVGLTLRTSPLGGKGSLDGLLWNCQPQIFVLSH